MTLVLSTQWQQETTERRLYSCRAAAAAAAEPRKMDECATPDKNQGSSSAGQPPGVLFNNSNRFCRIFFYLLREINF